jgi:hypothetical protein
LQSREIETLIHAKYHRRRHRIMDVHPGDLAPFSSPGNPVRSSLPENVTALNFSCQSRRATGIF